MELLKRKQGFEDSFFFIVVLFAICIIVLIVYYAWSQMKDPLAESIQGSLPAGTSVNISENLQGVTTTLGMFDILLPFILIGLFGFVLIGASLYMNNTLTAIIGIIVLAIAILLSMIYSNVYHQISSSDVLSDANAEFSIMEMFMHYLPYIVVVMFIFIIAAVIWSRQGGSGNL